MINIGLFSLPMNTKVNRYRGIYRLNNLCDYDNRSKQLKKRIFWLYDNSKDGGMSVPYSADNKEVIFQLYHNLIREKWQGDILIFGDENINMNLISCEFLGYDICADSMSYSPLGDGFLCFHDRENNSFDSELSFSGFLRYKNDINEKGLFDSFEIAVDFANYCNYINTKHSHAVESEDNWRVVRVYRSK